MELIRLKWRRRWRTEEGAAGLVVVASLIQESDSDPFASGGMGGRSGSGGGFGDDMDNMAGTEAAPKAPDGYGEPKDPKVSPRLVLERDGFGFEAETNRFMDALRQEGESAEAEYTKGNEASTQVPQSHKIRQHHRRREVKRPFIQRRWFRKHGSTRHDDDGNPKRRRCVCKG